MDQFSAHLDRGWDLAQKGDAAGATACARRALELDPDSPEVHNLLGFTAALRGDAEEALEHYRQAISLDDTYFEAMLNAAEILVHPLGEWDEAVALCDDAYELAETDEEVCDCILLKVDALMAKGDQEAARKAMALIPDGPFESSTYIFLIGRAYYELGDVDRAAPLIEEAARKDPEHADAQYYLGLVRDERGDIRGATEAFLRARQLDVARGAPTWAPPSEAFATIVRTSLDKLDLILGRYMRDAEVFVTEVPGVELVVDGVDPRALLLLDTAPPPSEDDDGPARPTRLFVYQRNVERVAGSAAAMEEELASALEREITAVFLEKTQVAAVADKHQLN